MSKNENKIPPVEFQVEPGIMNRNIKFIENKQGKWNWSYDGYLSWECVDSLEPSQVDFSSKEEAIKGFIQCAIDHYCYFLD